MRSKEEDIVFSIKKTSAVDFFSLLTQQKQRGEYETSQAALPPPPSSSLSTDQVGGVSAPNRSHTHTYECADGGGRRAAA